jgi:hypothetical protein
MSTTKALGYRWGGGAPAEPSTDVARLRHVLFTDIGSILAADAIALLPGWQRSRGATMEVAIAQFLGLPIYNAMTMDIIDLPKTPWGLLCDLKFEVAQTCTLVLNDLEELKKLEDN